jgi:hypothetical protein
MPLSSTVSARFEDWLTGPDFSLVVGQQPSWRIRAVQVSVGPTWAMLGIPCWDFVLIVLLEPPWI